MPSGCGSNARRLRLKTEKQEAPPALSGDRGRFSVRRVPSFSPGPPSSRYRFVTFSRPFPESFPVNSCPNGSKVGFIMPPEPKKLDKSGDEVYTEASFQAVTKVTSRSLTRRGCPILPSGGPWGASRPRGSISPLGGYEREHRPTTESVLRPLPAGRHASALPLRRRRHRPLRHRLGRLHLPDYRHGGRFFSKKESLMS